MKLHTDIRINGRYYAKGTDVPWYMIYPGFLAHMLGFGGVGFFIAYGGIELAVPLLYFFGGMAIIAI